MDTLYDFRLTAVNDQGMVAATTTARTQVVQDTLIYAVAPDAGPFSRPVVQVYDAVTNDWLYDIHVDQFGTNYTGGLRVAVGDVTGDGVPDIVVVPGRNAAPTVLVFCGADGSLREDLCIPAHATYGNSFKDGLNVAIGDVTGDGWNDIILVPSSGQAVVRVFENTGGGFRFARNFNAFEDNKEYIGGGSIAVGNIENAGNTEPLDVANHAQIVIGTGVGIAPVVRIFDVINVQPAYTAVREIKSERPEALGGVNVALGDLTGDGGNELLLSSKSGGRSWVDIYMLYPEATERVSSFQAFRPEEGNNVAVNITVHDTEIFVTQGAKGKAGPVVRKFQLDGQIVDEILIDLANELSSGLYIG